MSIIALVIPQGHHKVWKKEPQHLNVTAGRHIAVFVISQTTDSQASDDFWGWTRHGLSHRISEYGNMGGTDLIKPSLFKSWVFQLSLLSVSIVNESKIVMFWGWHQFWQGKHLKWDELSCRNSCPSPLSIGEAWVISNDKSPEILAVKTGLCNNPHSAGDVLLVRKERRRKILNPLLQELFLG